MASEQVMEVLVRRHVFDSERPFASVLDGVFGGISQPDIGLLFSNRNDSTRTRLNRLNCHPLTCRRSVWHAHHRRHQRPIQDDEEPSGTFDIWQLAVTQIQ